MGRGVLALVDSSFHALAPHDQESASACFKVLGLKMKNVLPFKLL